MTVHSISPEFQDLIKNNLISHKWLAAIIGLSIIMLLCTIFYPFGYDQAAFSVGGEMILKHGAVPYRDFLDTKPPLIFYIYALATALFGHHEWSIRGLDIFFQAGASLYFVTILRKSINLPVAILIVCVTLLQYIGTGFWHTAQAESFAFFPSLLLLDVTSRIEEPNQRAAYRFGVIAGLATIALFLLKFTFVLGAVAAIVYIIIRRDISGNTKTKYLLGFSTSFVVVLGGYILFLYSTGSLGRFLEGLQWVSRYASIDPLFGRNTISDRYFTLFPDRLIYTTTLTFFVFGCVGLAQYFRKMVTGGSQSIFGLFALTWGFQLLGVLAERKMFPYHYVRAMWAFSPFIAIGGAASVKAGGVLWKEIARKELLPRMVSVMLFVCVSLVALFYSPLVKLLSQSIPWTYIAIADKDSRTEVHERIGDYYADEQFSAGKYLKQHMAASDQMFFWGNDMSVYFYADKLPPTFCLTATPLRTSWTPQSWRDEMMHELTAAKPRYFVSEFGDSKEYITGNPRDSYQAFLVWPELHAFITENYREDTTIGHYRIFQRAS